MVNIKTVLIYHIHGCDDPKKRCEELLEFITIFHRSYVANNKVTIPLHDVCYFKIKNVGLKGDD